MKKKNLLIVLIYGVCLSAVLHAEEKKAPAAMSAKAREEYYEKAGMHYAKDLWQKQDNSEQDDRRSRKAETLSYQVRAKTIQMTEAQLTRSGKNPKLRPEILFRLGQLEEQQSESASRKSAGGNTLPLFQQHIKKAIAWQEQSLKEFPKFRADEVLYALGENYSHLLDIKHAEVYYLKLAREHKDSKLLPDALLALGNINFDRKGFAAARTHFNEILTIHDDTLHAYAHYKVAWCYFNESRYPEAMESLEKAVALSRKGETPGSRKLGVEDEALSDLVLFYSEYSNPNDAKAYFGRVVGEEKSKELRIRLAKRYFDQGQHENAKTVARTLLKEGVPEKDHGQILLVLLSVAEKTKDTELSQNTAKDLTRWIKAQKLDPNDPVQAESEEYLRGYCMRAHYAAETIKRKDLWLHAKAAYETYLDAYPENKELAEVRFRYGGLLFQLHQNKDALSNLKMALAIMPKDHPRLKETLQLRIQSIEMATKEQRKEIPETELITAYDDFVKAYPEDKLSPEAAFKSAELAKKYESPGQVATRFQWVAEKYPDHALAKSAVSNSLAVLVQSGEWGKLKAQSAALTGKTTDLVMQAKISEVKELAEMKLVEEIEQKNLFEEAHATYLKLSSQDFSKNFQLICLVKAAKLAEQKLNKPALALEHWEELQKRFPDAKESQGAYLEEARISESMHKPEIALSAYLAFAVKGATDTHNQALTNAALLEEKLHKRELAGDHFRELYTRLIASKGKDPQSALEASCNNYLLATYKEKSNSLLAKLSSCSQKLGMNGSDSPRWIARRAWALEQMDQQDDADIAWKNLSTLKLKQWAKNEELLPYIALGRLKSLRDSLAQFKTLRFTESNEKPNANLTNKTKALEALEQSAQALIKIGSPRTQIEAQKIIQAGYIEFAETMENAAVPRKLADAEKEAMKASFLSAAAQLREKAKAMAIPELVKDPLPRAPASANNDEAIDPVAKQYF